MSNESHNLFSQLERLPGQIERFYDTYFSVVREGLRRSDVASEAFPDFLEGYKRVLAVAGTDGVVVAHFPTELEITVSGKGTGDVLLKFSSEPSASQDTYEFVARFNLSARELAEMLSGEDDIGLEISAGVPWGAIGFPMPQYKIDAASGEPVWRAPWTRLICADFNSLRYWEDPGRAREEALEDLVPYLRRPVLRTDATVYEELDEVEAPRGIRGTDVEAGDQGVVVEVFERPRQAVLVEYADPEGRTKALVTYSPDLGRVLDIIRPWEDHGSVPGEVRSRPEPALLARVYEPAA